MTLMSLKNLFWNKWVVYIRWMCKLTDAVKPIWDVEPLHIHLFEKYLAISILYFRTLLLQVIKDHPIVNSFYVNLLSIFDIIKCLPSLTSSVKA